MRMWMINPKLMCRKHLFGEHVEHHMFLGTIKKGKSLDGYVRNNLLQLKDLVHRHDVLAEEITRRGYNHKSPLSEEEFLEHINKHHDKYQNILENSVVDVERSELDLFKRCPECEERRKSEYG